MDHGCAENANLTDWQREGVRAMGFPIESVHGVCHCLRSHLAASALGMRHLAQIAEGTCTVCYCLASQQAETQTRTAIWARGAVADLTCCSASRMPARQGCVVTESDIMLDTQPMKVDVSLPNTCFTS
jgi:hypothetical protein